MRNEYHSHASNDLWGMYTWDVEKAYKSKTTYPPGQEDGERSEQGVLSLMTHMRLIDEMFPEQFAYP